MWPFTRHKTPSPLDPFTVEVDLARLAPFAEAERYLLGYDVNGGVHHGMGVVYEAKRGERVHVFHSPGTNHRGGGMENFVEGIATQLRRSDPNAVALFTAWPADSRQLPETPQRLVRHVMAPNDGSVPGGLFTVDDDGSFTNLEPITACLYATSSFAPRPTTDELSATLGTPVLRFTEAEWEAAADLIDPDRSIRDAIKRRDDDAWANQRAILQEWDVWEPDRDDR